MTLLMGGAAETGVETTARIALHDDALRIADIAIAPSEENRVVARVPRQASGLSLTEEQRRTLLRNRVPGRQFRLRHTGTIWVERGAAKSPSHLLGGHCYSARTDLPAGSYLDRNAVAETACKAGAAERQLGYDADARAIVARRTISAGSYLGRLRLDDRAPVASGQAMVLRTSIGPVTVERNVTSLQPGRHGKRLFVRTDDGKLLASTLTGTQRAEDR
ncbi:hypothetical protein [Sphingopyxis sp.]|uniref:hypothetical protein n=1 Tax=Sphingopyxis sp. TaxID=1908224 RepID=UPI002FCBCCBA